MTEVQLLSSQLRSEGERKTITLFESMSHSPEDVPVAHFPKGLLPSSSTKLGTQPLLMDLWGDTGSKL